MTDNRGRRLPPRPPPVTSDISDDDLIVQEDYENFDQAVTSRMSSRQSSNEGYSDLWSSSVTHNAAGDEENYEEEPDDDVYDIFEDQEDYENPDELILDREGLHLPPPPAPPGSSSHMISMRLSNHSSFCASQRNSSSSASNASADSYEDLPPNNAGVLRSSSSAGFSIVNGLNSVRIQGLKANLKPVPAKVKDKQVTSSKSLDSDDQHFNLRKRPTIAGPGGGGGKGGRGLHPQWTDDPIVENDIGDGLNSIKIRDIKSSLRRTGRELDNRTFQEDKTAQPDIGIKIKQEQTAQQKCLSRSSSQHDNYQDFRTNGSTGDGRRTITQTPDASRTKPKPTSSAGHGSPMKRLQSTVSVPIRTSTSAEDDDDATQSKGRTNSTLSFGRESQDPSDLSLCSWYFGRLGRDDCEEKLRKMLDQDGSYLVRESQRGSDENPFTLSLVFKRNVYHLHIRRRPDGKFSIGKEKPDEKVFNSVPEMISFHHNNNLELLGDPKKKAPAGKVTLKKCPQNHRLSSFSN